jgi:hypothetical protein
MSGTTIDAQNRFGLDVAIRDAGEVRLSQFAQQVDPQIAPSDRATRVE